MSEAHAPQHSDFDSLLPAAQLNRREFVTTLAAAGFALAVQPVQASTLIRTDDSGLDESDEPGADEPAAEAEAPAAEADTTETTDGEAADGEG